MTRIHRLTMTVFLILAPFRVYAQQRPLQTDDPEILTAGHIRLQTGFEFLQNQPFGLSGLQGDLKRTGIMGVYVGAGSLVEFQLTGSAWNSLSIERRIPAFNTAKLRIYGDSTGSVGDFMLAAKFRLSRETASRPALSFRFGVELPNASEKKGLSNNQTNFYADFLLGKSFGKFRALANLGLAILDNPTSLSSQKDLFTYGVAGVYAIKHGWTLLSEVNGRAGPGGPGTEEQSWLRVGTRYQWGKWRWDVAGIAGLAEHDPDTGIAVGISYQFKAFKN